MGMSYSTQYNPAKFKQSMFARKGRVYKAMREAAEQGAERIMAQSQSNSPVDTHNLEEAHHITTSTTAADNIRYSVEVSGLGYGADRPRDVGNYIVEVHENYENMGRGGHPRPGSKSYAKMQAGHAVGSKFLERALETEKPFAINGIRRAVRQAL